MKKKLIANFPFLTNRKIKYYTDIQKEKIFQKSVFEFKTANQRYFTFKRHFCSYSTLFCKCNILMSCTLCTIV